MRVVIDMQGAQSESRYRGIGRYTRTFVTHLLSLNASREHEYFLLFNGELPQVVDELISSFRALVPRQNIVTFEPLPSVAWRDTPNHRRAEAMESVREAVISELRPDVVLVSSLFEGFHDDAVTSIKQFDEHTLTAVIHYDLIPALHPTYLGEGNPKLFYERKLRQIPKADLLLAISESSRREALELFSLAEEKAVNISTAVGPEFVRSSVDSLLQQSALSRLGVSGCFVLYVPGGFDARKNFARLLEAFSRLSRESRAGVQLVITGFESQETETKLREMATSMGLRAGDLVLPGYVSDQDLIMLYRCAKLFVFPSLHEGFGLPVLEAMSCGAPVIVANSTSLPEVVGNPAALFDPRDVDAIARSMEAALKDVEFRQSLCESAQQQVEKFSWRGTAETALAALEQLVQARSPVVDGAGALSALPERVVEALTPAATGTELIEMAQCLAHNFSRGDAEPQLLLDVTELRLTDSQTGIQRVVRSLLLAFLRAPPSGFAVSAVYFDGYRFRYARRFSASFAGLATSEDEVVDFRSGDVYLSLDFTVRTTPQAERMLKTLSRRGVRLCFIVYDLLPLLHPYWWPEGMSVSYERWLRSLSSVADTVCCISQSVANELDDWMNKSTLVFQYQRPAVCWFHLGADLEQSAPSTGWPQSYAAVTAAMDERTTFLMVGTLEPRKGHAQAIEAFEALWADGHPVNLVIVGKPGWMVDDLIERIRSHPESGGQLFWLSNASDECLEDVYCRATCLLAASEAEGFGLPLIEAARRGLPILARDLPVFREVAGSAAYYFADNSDAALSESIARWLVLYQEGKAPNPDSLAWLTWQQSASQLMAILLPSHNLTREACPDC